MTVCGNGCRAVANDDLVNLTEAARELGVRPETLFQGRRTSPGFPAPAVEGRTVKLYSMAALRRWDETREKRSR